MVDRFNRDKLDESIEAKLLANGFSYHDDYEYGPQSGWGGDCEMYTMCLTKHGFGYSIFVSAHASGTNKGICLGSSNSAEHIISLRDSLAKLF